MLDGLKCFVMKKMGIFTTSTQIPESDYAQGHNIYGVSKINVKAIK